MRLQLGGRVLKSSRERRAPKKEHVAVGWREPAPRPREERKGARGARDAASPKCLRAFAARTRALSPHAFARFCGTRLGEVRGLLLRVRLRELHELRHIVDLLLV